MAGGWTDWSLDPSLVYVVPAGAMYWLGGVKARGRRLAGSPAGDRLRAASFTAGLATIVIALDSPLDGYADTLFWAHMLQHILLLTVAPPLILLGRPWPRMWRALPLSWRTRAGRAVARSSPAAPIRSLARPLPAWLLFNATVVVWHLGPAYDAALAHGAIHALQHVTFFVTGLAFWAYVVDPGPLRPRLAWPVRVAYVAGAMVVGWVLAIVLVLAPHPLYAHYAALATRPGGISALTDQQIAGGMMWVPGSISYTIAVLFAFWRWVEPTTTAPPARGATSSTAGAAITT